MSMNLEILGTDGPLTRGRRRALADAGVMPGATPGLLADDAATAKHLFTDRTNNVDQVQPTNADCSPVEDWVKAAGGTDASIAFDLGDQNECPLTPSLGSAFKRNKKECKSIAASPCGDVNGPTPTNTPTSASVPQPAPVLLSMAVNELQQNGENSVTQLASASINEDNECPTSPLEDDVANTGDLMDEVNNEGKDLAELLEDLDIVAQASPLVAEVSGNQNDSSITHCAPVLGGALRLSPTYEDRTAVDDARDFSITNAPSESAESPSMEDNLCTTNDKSAPEDVMTRDQSWMHSEHQEQPTEAGPFPDVPYQLGTPAAPTGISRAPNVASTRMGTPGARVSGTGDQNNIDLGAVGCDDVIPTPGFFRPGSGLAPAPLESPATPEDAPIKPFTFSTSAGSQFATPEVNIHTGMSPVTTAADSRHAQKHIPAWNRCIKLVEKSYPLVARQIKSLASMPGPHPAWAHTPYMLLHSICTTKGWELSVRHESAPRIGVDASVIATVNIPAVNDSGRTFTATGRNQGQLESLLLAAAGTLQELMKHHMISGKDAISAVSQAKSSLRHGSVPSVVGNMLHFGKVPVPSGNAAGSSMPQQKRPPRPHSSRRSAMRSTPSAAGPMAGSGPGVPFGAVSPHPGIGVRVFAECSNTPELVPVDDPEVEPVTLANRHNTRSSAPSPVYHPPMRTGTSSVSNKSKASIGATAKPIGIKALKEHQKELARNMKRDNAALAALQKATEKLSVTAPLRGLPVPNGSHVVYHEDGRVEEQPRRKSQLRGMPGSLGSYKRFSIGDGQ